MIFHKISSNVLFIYFIFFVSVSLCGSKWKLDMLYTYNSRFTYAYTWSHELIRLSYTRFTFCSHFFSILASYWLIWKYIEYLSSVFSILFKRHIKKKKKIYPWFQTSQNVSIQTYSQHLDTKAYWCYVEKKSFSAQNGIIWKVLFNDKCYFARYFLLLHLRVSVMFFCCW